MESEFTAPLFVVLSAPSGAGKTTLCDNLLDLCPTLTRAITCTTRKPRPGERDGLHYYFLDPEEFARRAENGLFLEQAMVYGNRYGTLKSEVMGKLRRHQDALLCVDVQGAATIQARADGEPELRRALVTVFLAPSSMAELRRRLELRGEDSPEVIEQRLGIARREITQWKHFQYLIVSQTREADLAKMRAIVEAEKLRQFRATPPPRE